MLDVSLRIEINPGTKLEDAFGEAIRLATMLNVRIRFKFNGVNLSAKPDSDLDKCVAGYYRSTEEED